MELVHQRDSEARRHLAALDIVVYGDRGDRLGGEAVDATQEILDLGALARPLMSGRRRVMITFDARYDERVFPYRPHHYAYLHRRGSSTAPLYYAVNAVLGGVPDRIGATGINNFEVYLFPRRTFAERYSILLGNLSRFAAAQAQLFAYYGAERVVTDIGLEPKAHAQVGIASTQGNRPLERVEVKALFKLATYVVGRTLPRTTCSSSITSSATSSDPQRRSG